MIEVEAVSIRQGDFVLDDVSFRVTGGQYAVLMGRSGCGKTSILEIICGLRRPRSGRILLDGVESTRKRPGERGVGYVPQDRALFPTLPVGEQIAFALLVRKRPHAEIAARVREVASWLGITHLLDRMPDHLSGGEAQRVALGRALASRPRVLCLDEPLSALDEETHDEICDLLSRIHRESAVTVLHVTHSHREAHRLGDCLFRLEAGEVRRV